ncbi:MAG: glycoside hydrolase, partial [Gemmatimonadaceae bacterium]
ARQTWESPASAGKYANTVKASPLGTITAFSPSSRSAGILWAGTDDGLIQVTMNGGATWSNVTPPAIKPWTRIFNIEAGHFDNLTAYAAANTMRIDEYSPHFWRTHDGGKHWQEINTGIADGAVANSIREDTRQKGLLYAATDAQVWLSYDDGDHWESLRSNMPAISVRDLQMKDDSSCLCSDLIAGTHGRGFWILDNVTPLRQSAAIRQAKANNAPYLVRPATAVRVRSGTNDPTPWPPEVPAGDNPVPGAILDYYLPSAASSPVTIEILDATGKVIRTHSSNEPTLKPDPAIDPEGYNKVCQKTPTATDCGLPLYWPAPAIVVSTTAGMHRFAWDLHYAPLPAEDIEDAGDEEATGAVPHHTYPSVNAPWAPPGAYTVRLTVDGKKYTQPLTLRLDPRVKTTAAVQLQLANLSRDMWEKAKETHADFMQARGLVDALSKAGGSEADAFKAQIESLAPSPSRGARPNFRRRGPATPTLEAASQGLMGAAMAMQGADIAPTATQVAACAKARAQAAEIIPKWNALKTTGLASFNAKRKAAGQSEIVIPRNE